jgi:hypothetical protein
MCQLHRQFIPAILDLQNIGEGMRELIFIVAGIVLRSVYQALQAYIYPRYRLRRLRRILPISDVSTQKDVLIRPSLEIQPAGMNGKSKRAYTHSSETIALQKIAEDLANLPLNLHFNYDVVAAEKYSSWILLGLSRKTILPKEIYDQLESETGIRVVKTTRGPTFNHQFFRGPDGTEYHCEHVPDPAYESRVTKDFGLIYRSVLNNGASVLLCGGIHMYGTLAAVEVAFSEEFQKRAAKARNFRFAQIVEVQVREDGINIDRTSIKWKSLPFVAPKRIKNKTYI